MGFDREWDIVNFDALLAPRWDTCDEISPQMEQVCNRGDT